MYKHILEINAREWFDRVNGNSYFSARVVFDDKEVAILPFQYGYGDHYIDQANDAINKTGIINNPQHENGSREPLWSYCRKNNIKLITNKKDKCLKRDVVGFGE